MSTSKLITQKLCEWVLMVFGFRQRVSQLDRRTQKCSCIDKYVRKRKEIIRDKSEKETAEQRGRSSGNIGFMVLSFVSMPNSSFSTEPNCSRRCQTLTPQPPNTNGKNIPTHKYTESTQMYIYPQTLCLSLSFCTCALQIFVFPNVFHSNTEFG